MYQDYLDAPKGFPKPYISITANEKGITSLYFVSDKEIVVNSNSVINQCIQQLKEYFGGKRTTFSVPLAPEGTEFQNRVWKTLQTIPYGEIWSYKKLALTLGSVNYCRAVGMANSRNPISLIIPCHRVIGHNGKLVGYTGGLDIKRWLLQYEKVDVDE
ncbi:methylated-DNA--[protein]-cysteine S-methyltransferase [Proteus vulgaris]|uniref:methylated-DNA--[protein]-cysteine S-methyltransferase n=1 Tax=Proteus vulgaris TaxID=585 RepID=UPI0034D79B73